MAPGDKGLLVHYGVWAILISDPLLLISASFAWFQFRTAFQYLPLRNGSDNRLLVRKIVRPYRDFVTLKGYGSLLYLGLLSLGFLSWLNNLRQTSDPVRYFKHNVFDSTEFIYGFAANKLVLFTSWVLIYPAVGFVILSMGLSTYFILNKFAAARIMQPNIFHPDGCYGFSSLGRLNICLLVPYFFAFFVALAILITHESIYPSIVIPLVFLTGVLLTISYVTIKPIVSQVKVAERTCYKKLINDSMILNVYGHNTLKFGLERICFALSSSSPYSKGTKSLLVAMRAIPVMTTVFKLALSLA